MASHVPRLAQRFKQLATLLWFTVLLLAWFAPAANAASHNISEESDWYFTVDSDDTQVTIYGNSNTSCANYVTGNQGTDPYLWLYDSDGALVTKDDDSNHNANDQCVSAKIYTTLDAGTYRLRAGYYPQQLGLGNSPYTDGRTWELIIDFDVWTTSTTTATTTTSTTTTLPPTTTSSSTTTSSTTTVALTTSTTEVIAPTTTAPTTTTSSTTSTTTTTTTTTQPPPPPPPLPPPTSPPTTTSTTSTTSTTTSTTTTSTTTTTTTTIPPTTTTSTTTPNTTTTSPPTSTTVIPITTPLPSPARTESSTPSATVATTVDTTTSSTTTTTAQSEPAITTTTTTTIQPAPPADAPVEEKQTFEQEVNIYSGDYEEYVPVGSSITVAERRTIVAITTVTSVVAAPTRSRRR